MSQMNQAKIDFGKFCDCGEELRCPRCGHSDCDACGVWDVLGACDGNVFCVQCHCEIDDNGHPHVRGKCCDETMEEMMRPKHMPQCERG